MPHFEVVFPKGVGFRLSTDLQDRATGARPARCGEVLEGELVGNDNWLELSNGEGLFLPLRANDGTVLVRKMESRDLARPKFVPWKGADEDPPPAVDYGRAASAAFGDVRPPSGRRDEASVGGAGRSDELMALDQRYDQKKRVSGRRSPGAVARAAPPRAPAAAARPPGQLVNSHDKTTAYMHEFRDALEDIGVDTRDDPYLNRYAPSGGAVDAVVPGPGAVPRSSSRSGSASGSRMSGSPASIPLTMCGATVVNRSAASGGTTVVNRSAASGSQAKWDQGPANAIVPVKEWTSVKHGHEVQNRCSSGRVVDVSDRNVLCMSVLGDKAVTGSADHGLKELSVSAGRSLRTLYTKRFGHTEWVTTVCHCPDGRVLSGGQDSKVCLWNSTGAACVDLTGHLGSISRVRVEPSGKIAISAAYDRTLGVWDLRAKRSAASITGHNAPVLEFVWWDDVVASGDRSGIVKLWDTNQVANIGTLKGHKGHITAMLAMSDGDGVPTIVTGAQDGQIRIWDLRQKLNTNTLNCHPGGAVNDVCVTVGRNSPLLVSTGADGRVLVLEPRSNYAPLHEFGGVTEDFLYSLLVLDSVAFVGDGRGVVTCFDLQDGKRKYTLNAGENAVRCLGATESSLVTAGDDGNVIIFDF